MKRRTRSQSLTLALVCGLVFSAFSIFLSPAAVAADGDLGSLDFASTQTKYLEYNSASSAFAFGTGDFTIEYWWKPTANRRSDVMDFWSDPIAGSAQTTRFILGTFGGAPHVYVDDKVQGSGAKISGSSNLTLNTWHHIAVTRSSGVIKMWINGTQAGSSYSSSLDMGNVGMKLSVMKDHGAGANGSGKITGARVVMGSSIYNSAFTRPSTAPGYINGTTFLLNAFQGASNYLRDSSATNLSFTSASYPDSSIDTPFTAGEITLAPNISSISASTGNILGGRSVRVTGSYLLATSQIKFDGVAGTSLVVESSTSVLVTTPAGTLGAKNVVLSTASGATTLVNGFTYVSTPVPAINSLSITEGTTAGGTSTVISGTNLDTATSATVDGNRATIVSNSSTAISITTPAGTEGAKNVVVTTAGGSATIVGAFTYSTRFAVSYVGGVGTTGTAPVQASIAPNETFTVASGSAISKIGYTFSKWKDGNNAEYLPGETYTVTNATVTLTAQWTLSNYVVSFLAGAHGDIAGETTQNVNHGDSSTQVTAEPDPYYHFVSWSDASTVNPRTISSVETTTSLTATFAIDTYTATYNSGGNGAISGTATQTINHGENATAVTATPSANYYFVSWSDGVLTATRLDASLTGSISKTASFAIDAHAITFNANGGSGGSTVSVNYNENAVASSPIVSRSQFTFAGWAETVTASSIATWTVVGPKTLYSLWNPRIYSVTYNAESGTALTAIETFTVGSAPIQLQSATRAGYKFNGWYTDKSGGSFLGITGANYTPSDTATVHAQWTQASLVGLSSPTSFGTIIATSGNDGGISATRSGTKAEIDYFADSLPDNTVITAYLQGSTAYAASQLTGVTNLLLSVVVAWKSPDETVPVVDPAKSAIRLKITNAGIKRGAKVYSIAGDSSTILTTATQDGFVVIELREDPEIVIANPVEVPAPPAPPTPPAPTPPSITAAPIVDNSAAENAAKLKAEEEAKKAAELKAAQEKAAKDLQAAREKADAEIKAAQDAADLDAKLKAEADARLAADLKAKEDAEIAAKLASQKIVPDVTLYSISPSLKLSVYDATYLKSYVATLKPKATVTCIGYIYPKNTTLAKAKLKATSQATAVCKLIKAQRKSLTTKVVIYPASKAPKAAAGAKWVAVSYRVDGFRS
ncbi:IPT domain containing protein [Candidatus Nanopelagicaceae bacterium]